MGGSKRFWLGVVLGALTGGAISLLEKTTRTAVKEDFSKVSRSMSYVVKNPEEFLEDIKDTANKVRSTVEQVTEDVHFLAEKVEEIRDVPNEVSELVKGTKATLKKIASGESKTALIDEK